MLRNSFRAATALTAFILLGGCSGDLPQQSSEGRTIDPGVGGSSGGQGTPGSTPGNLLDPGGSNSGSASPGPAPGASLSPGGTVAPSGGGTPTPGGSSTPTPGGSSTPTPGGSSTPTPGGSGTPTPGGTGPANPGPGSSSTPVSGPTATPGGGGAGTGAGGNPPVDVGTGGTPPEGGAPGAAGMGPDLDQNGKANAKPGDMTSQAQDYLRLGDIRILNNNWGSEDLGCNAPMSVFINQDSTFGWSFNRGDCDTANSNQKPDFPQIEFGIHPFGIGSDLVTSPEFSSTTLLPLQIKDIQSASVSIQNMNANLQRDASWNITFEFWLSQGDPVNDPNPGVYAEIMTFWGWESGRWPEPPNGDGPTGNGAGNQVSSGGKSYTLWVQDDNWASGWRYFQFRADDGPQRSFNGTVDVKPLLDYLVNQRQYSSDLWVSRLEVGSEIDDETQGTVQMSGITFEVNGESRSATFGN